MPSRVIATCLALIAFTMSTVLGMAAGNPPITIVWRAFLMMAVVWGIGSIIGLMAQRVVADNIAAYKLEHPLASEDDVRRGKAPDAIDDDIADMATEHEREDEAARQDRNQQADPSAAEPNTPGEIDGVNDTDGGNTAAA